MSDAASGASPPRDGRSSTRALWAVTLVGVGAALVIFLAFGHTWPRALFSLSIAVVPADESDLDCEMSAPLGATSCQYEGNGRSSGASSLTLHPYRAASGDLVLLAGVFEDATVATWSRRFPSGARGPRVALDCEAQPLPPAERVGIRFSRADEWDHKDHVPAAVIRGCRIAP